VTEQHVPPTAWAAVGEEIAGVLARVVPDELAAAARFLGDRGGRWFFTGQGRSGLVAQMAAMRVMHLGRPTHVVGEATAPSVRAGDHVVALSASGETPVTLHLARLAREQGADVLAVTTRPASPLGALAGTTLHVSVVASGQFGGSLFEQCALVLLDAVVLQLTGPDAEAHERMARRHTNLQ